VRYNLVFSGGRRDNKGGVFLILAIAAVLWIGYMATLFMRFALSRRREYMADAGSVELTKNPEAMMRALMRIAGRDQIPQAPADVSMMCIENSVPFFGLFSTHPPIEARIKQIAAMTGAEIPTLSLPPAPPEQRFQSEKREFQNPWLVRGRGPRRGL
jgi:heat shock protein HtpX